LLTVAAKLRLTRESCECLDLNTCGWLESEYALAHEYRGGGLAGNSLHQGKVACLEEKRRGIFLQHEVIGQRDPASIQRRVPEFLVPAQHVGFGSAGVVGPLSRGRKKEEEGQPD
jgi:hypothetical protein